MTVDDICNIIIVSTICICIVLFTYGIFVKEK